MGYERRWMEVEGVKVVEEMLFKVFKLFKM